MQAGKMLSGVFPAVASSGRLHRGNSTLHGRTRALFLFRIVLWRTASAAVYAARRVMETLQPACLASSFDLLPLNPPVILFLTEPIARTREQRPISRR
jgi:hypothetical protein